MKNAVSTDAPRAGRGSLFRAAAGLLLALGLLVPSFPGTAEAATVGFKVSGKWTDADGGDRVAGEGSNRLSWGGLSRNRRSEYIFGGLNPNVDVKVPSVTPVDLGRFTHRNYRIPDDSGIDGADLKVHVDVMVDGFTQRLSPLTFALDHWETDNRASPCANGAPNRQGLNSKGCADRIEFTSNPFETESFVAGGITYRFRVLGFFDPATNAKLGVLWTKEKNDNVAVLRGEITAVPVPAAGLLLLGGIGGLGFLAARRRR